MESLRIQLVVIGALVLRDMRTRFGRSHLSFIFYLALPFFHIVVVMVAWTFMKRGVPLGTSPIVFFATGILPFIAWTYPYRQIAMGVVANKPMLYFSRVKVIDIMLARSCLESLAAFVVVALFVAVVTIIGEDVSPKDPFMTVAALLGALYFGIAFGMLNGLIAALLPPWSLFMSLLTPCFWATSGIMFMIETIPSPYREWLAINPLLQCVELMRESYYWDYRSSVVSLPYIVGFSTALIALVLFAERQVRGRILQG